MPDTPLEFLTRELGAAFGRLEKEIRQVADLLKAESLAGTEKLQRELADVRLAVALLREEQAQRVAEALRSLSEQVASRIAEVRDGKDGKDADAQEIATLLIPEVERAVAAIPLPRDGKDADPDFIRAVVADAVAVIPAPRDGKDGENGKDGLNAEIPEPPNDVVEMIAKTYALLQMPSPVVEAPAQAAPRQKTITMTKDKHGNAVAHVVEEAA